MPKKSHAKSSPVRKDFFYYLPLITSIVVNLFWGMFSIFVLFPYFGYMSLSASYFGLPVIWQFMPVVVPLVIEVLFIISLLVVVKRTLSHKVGRLLSFVNIVYAVFLIGSFFLASSKTMGFEGFFLNPEVLRNPIFFLLHVFWLASSGLVIFSLVSVLFKRTKY